MVAPHKHTPVRARVVDHPDQVTVVRRLTADNSVSICRTVMLQTLGVPRALQENAGRTAETRQAPPDQNRQPSQYNS